MDAAGEGSVWRVGQRLERWLSIAKGGFSVVSFASEFARKEVVRHLQRRFRLAEHEVRAEADAASDDPGVVERVDSLVTDLQRDPSGAASVLLYAAPLAEAEFERLCGRLNLFREKLAGMNLPLVFWIPSGVLGRFTRSVPDFDSWAMLRLELTEIVRPPGPGLEAPNLTGSRMLPAEARRTAELFASQARKLASGTQTDDALLVAARAIRTLSSAGLLADARELAEEFRKTLGDLTPAGGETLEAYIDLREAAGDWNRQERLATIERLVQGQAGEASQLKAISAQARLAEARWAAGDLPGARKIHEQVLDVRRRVLGEEHPDTLTSMNNLAQTLYTQGDLPGARKIQEQVLDVRRRVLGQEHPATLTSMNNLAQTLKAQGDLPGARKIQEQVLDVSRRLLGEEHPATLASMNNLAQTLKAQGDLPGARKMHEQVLDVLRRVRGEEHPDTLTSMNNLAATLQDQGDLPAAHEIQEQVLDVSRRVLGEEHPDTLTSMNNLAQTLYAQGDLPGARKIEEQVLDVRRRVLGVEHPDTLTSMNNLAQTLKAQGDLPGARKMQEQVLGVSRRVLGQEHPDTLTNMNNLAQTLFAQGNLPGALKIEEQVLDVRRRVLGQEHPDTLTSMNNLAQTLYTQGDLPGARKMQEQVLDVRRRVLGEEHPATLVSAWNLFGTLSELQDRDAAMRVFSAYLAPLLQRDPATLPADLREIQAALAKAVE
jgi:tetratricopeptide (TPR) repeat protein